MVVAGPFVITVERPSLRLNKLMHFGQETEIEQMMLFFPSTWDLAIMHCSGFFHRFLGNYEGEDLYVVALRFQFNLFRETEQHQK